MSFLTRFLLVAIFYFIEISICISNTDIVGYEYWFDKDYVNKVYQPVSNFTGTLNTAVPIENFSEGIHSIHFRFLNNSSKWSSVSSRYFNVRYSENPNLVVSLEYWFDNSFLQRQNLNLQAQTVLTYNDSIDVSALSNRIHSLNYIFKDQSGNWSSIRTSIFNKNIAKEKNIVALEYWFDNDYANNYNDILPLQNNTNFNSQIKLNSLSGGCHALNYRYLDNEGIWSAVQGSSSFCILNLSLKAFVQGYYLSDGTMTPALYNCGLTDDINVCDSITVELRQNAYPYNVVYQNTGLIDVNGNTSFALPESVLNNSYYIVLKHRNAIETWSKYPVILNSSITNFNFTR